MPTAVSNQSSLCFRTVVFVTSPKMRSVPPAPNCGSPDGVTMDFAMFHSRFPEIAEAETRTITILRHDILPADEYALLESYCERSGCDCRRVMLSVVARRQQQWLAVISYGWEDKSFYQSWSGDDDPVSLREMQGPALNRMSRQSPLAPALLQLVTEVALGDEEYVARLVRHYRLFKKSLKKRKKHRKKMRPRRAGRHETRDV